MAQCTNCGAEVAEGAGFCPTCGTALAAPETAHWAVPAGQTPPASQIPPAGQVSPSYPVQPPKKKGGALKWVLIAVGVVVVLAIIGGTMGGGDETTTTTGAPVASTPADTTPASEPVDTVETSATTEPATTEPATTEPPTTVAPVAKQWVSLSELSGSTNKTGDVFELTGAPASIAYDITEGLTAVYIMKDGTNLESDGGFPEITSMDAVKDATRLVLDPGRYYLVVNAMSPYVVEITEQR
jgi:hypothetical protein